MKRKKAAAKANNWYGKCSWRQCHEHTKSKGDDLMGFGELSAVVPPATAAVLIVVYRMLSNDISSLKSCIDALALEVKQLRQDIAKNNELTGRIEEKAASAHKRLDGFERRIEHLEKRCEHCTCKD